MNTRAPRSLLIASLAALVLAGCGGEGAAVVEDDPTTTTTQPTTTTEQPTTTAQPDTSVEPYNTEELDTTDAQEGDAGVFEGLDGLSPVCLEAAESMSAALNSYSTGMAGAMGGDLGEQDLEDAAAQLQAMADAAPPEIQDDLEVIATELGAFYEALAASGFDAGETPTAEQIEELTQLTESLDQEAFETATANIDAWFQENCES